MTNLELQKELSEKYGYNLALDLIDHIHAVTVLECMEALPEERIIHSYMPHQNTPENNAWNDYRTEAIAALKNLSETV